MTFIIKSDYKPQGDQPLAIADLSSGLSSGIKAQTLMGVTGSGKTFTMANVIANINKPTLVISHNKTLAAQLYNELKQFFPNNRVEYFVSYYDYYQPEAYLPASGKYIEKDLLVNKDLERLRLSAITALLTNRSDVIIVSSVSCIYGLGDPNIFIKNSLHLKVGQTFIRDELLLALVNILYSRSIDTFNRGTFRVNGDVVDVFLAYDDFAYRFLFWGNEIEHIQKINPITGEKVTNESEVIIFPANPFVTSRDMMEPIISNIEADLDKQVDYFAKLNLNEEANRIKQRTELDIEMMREIGYCSGIENYSRYFDGRQEGMRPFCLLDYFPSNYLMMIDESHVTLPQVRAMWGGDRVRKENLVNNGFRLPSALDNRPLNFEEFKALINQVIYISATPSNYELADSKGVVVEQIIRPTGLLDPKIEVKTTVNQIDDLIAQIYKTIERGDKILVLALTKRMAEELSKYLTDIGISCSYIHSEVKTLDRVEIINKLKTGVFDVLIGVNLIREGLDLPEVGLVIILDADKEGFLRNETSLIQMIGRVARNSNGKVIMYADTITKSMHNAIKETERRRKIQLDYNTKHNITPTTVFSKGAKLVNNISKAEHTKPAEKIVDKKYKKADAPRAVLSEAIIKYMTKNDIIEMIKATEIKMHESSEKENFNEAAYYRDIVNKLKKAYDNK
jgi:excinuclease ABC subunit B